MLYFYHRYFHIQYNCYYKNYLLIIVFFMLKKVPNSSNYSALHCFIFFLQSKKTSYIFNCGVICLFFSLKISFTSLIILSSILYLFQSLNFSSLYVVKKLIIKKKRTKSLLYFFKNHLEIQSLR